MGKGGGSGNAGNTCRRSVCTANSAKCDWWEVVGAGVQMNVFECPAADVNIVFCPKEFWPPKDGHRFLGVDGRPVKPVTWHGP